MVRLRMKKIVVILLLTIYAAGVVGMTINYHYCAGHLAKISVLNFGHPKSCGCNPKNMPRDCCKDILTYHKNDSHRLVAIVAFAAPGSLVLATTPTVSEYAFRCAGKDNAHLGIFTVPRRSPYPIFLLCSVFRI